jgi:hypothetical protein
MAARDDEIPNGDADETGDPPRHGRPRLRLDSLDRVRRELTKIYRQGRDGERDVGDSSKLANILALIARILEGTELEKRVAALEAAKEQRS